MKNPSCIPIIGFLSLGLLVGGAALASAEGLPIGVPAFVDIEDDHPFGGDIRWMWQEGHTLGCDPPANDRFCPDQDVTRGEMATFVSRVLDLPPGPDAFQDDDGSVFEDDIDRLAMARISTGCDPPVNAGFCPDRLVTRGEMAAFIDRAFQLAPTLSDHFGDDDGTTFETNIDRLGAAGVAQGCDPPMNRLFCPDRSVTRAEMAAFLRRASGADPAPPMPDGTSVTRTSQRIQDVWRVDTQVCSLRTDTVALSIRNIVTGTGASALVEVVDFPSRLTTTSGVVTEGGDRWDVELDPQTCQSLEGVWNPGVNGPEWPTPAPVITSPFGIRWHPILGGYRLHAGLDLAGDYGDSVLASIGGTVVRAGPFGGYGNVVDVVGPGGMLTRYAHLSLVSVAIDDVVEEGDVLGGVGCTGLCTGPHLHFELRIFGEAIDPLPRVFGPAPTIDPVTPAPD